MNVYGNDCATSDGTVVRDYIHVQELTQAHVVAVQTLLQGADSFTVNVGPGHGHCVLEVVRRHTLANMCTDAWRWQSNNPNGCTQNQPFYFGGCVSNASLPRTAVRSYSG